MRASGVELSKVEEPMEMKLVTIRVHPIRLHSRRRIPMDQEELVALEEPLRE